MALNKEQLKADIKAAFEAQATKTEDPEEALSSISEGIANAVDAYVKSATITASQANIAAAALANGGGPVVASGQIVSNIS